MSTLTGKEETTGHEPEVVGETFWGSPILEK